MAYGNSDEQLVHTGGEDQKKFSFTKEILSTFGVLLAALLIAFGLITFVFQSYEVDGQSMETSLQDQDRLIVWKVPHTWSKITHTPYIPNRGDVIVFNETGLEPYGSTETKQLIKRVIAVPGERVVVKDGKITVYNSENPRGFNPDQELPYGESANIPYTSGNIEITLGEDEIFVCGDNRGASLDSRAFGPITSDQIVGKLIARIYPFANAEKF